MCLAYYKSAYTMEGTKLPKGEHLRGKKSRNPAARSVLHEGVHDGRFLRDRRHSKRYDAEADHSTGNVVLDGNVPVGSFEDWLIGNLDKEGLPDHLRAIENDRARKNFLARKFWEYLEDQGVKNAGN